MYMRRKLGRETVEEKRNSFLRVLRRVLCLLPLLLLAVLVPTSDAQTPTLTGIAHVAIRVSNLAKSRAFYEKLGYQEAFAMDKGGSPTEAFIKVNDRQFIELYPQREPSQQVGFMHVCFEAADLDAVDRDYLAHGLSPTPVKRAGAGNLLFTLQGPEHQNIEYTQYMPGSKHTMDRGMHLGVDRISEQISGLGIEMNDPSAAESFYEEKLGFRRSSHLLEHGVIALDLPGEPNLNEGSKGQLEILQHTSGSTFRFLLAVPDLKRAGAQLKTLGIPVEKSKSLLSITDPDGNHIVFVKGR